MKILIASDIHGSNHYTKKLVKIIERENPDQIILLGDIYYHGPRNKLPRGYAPQKVVENLGAFADKIRCVKGNCDAEVDQMISKFKFEDSIEMDISNKKFLFVHGHKLDFNNPPKDYDFIVGGHTHVSEIRPVGKLFYVNPGSLSIPKIGTKNSYALINNNTLAICTFSDVVTASITIWYSEKFIKFF